jgi:hypothetical protein
LIPLGIVVGTFGTLVGAGGGFVLVPVLLLLYPHKEAETITSMSLFVVCANAASGTVAYARQKRIDFNSGFWFVAGTFPGAIAGAIVVGYIPRRTFDAIFAAVLTGIGLFLVLRSSGTAISEPVTGRGVVRRRITDAQGNTFAYAFNLWKGVTISTGIGFLSSLLGIGGGVIHVPVMATMLHFPVHIATATSQFVLMFMAGEGTAVHFATGALSWDHSLFQAALLALGAVPGAQIGARLSHRIHGGIIMRALAAALVLVGARLALKAIQG